MFVQEGLGTGHLPAHACVVLLTLKAGEFSDDEVFFYQNVKGGQHNFVNLIPKCTGDPSV